MKLYEITNELKSIEQYIDKVDVFTEEDQQMLLEALNNNSLSLEAKVEGTIIMMRQFASEEEILADEIKRLTTRKRQLTAKTAWFKQYLKENLIAQNVSSLKTKLFSITIYDTGKQSVEIADPLLVPDFYKTPTVTYTIDKARILNEFQTDGMLPNGVFIKPATKAMRIT